MAFALFIAAVLQIADIITTGRMLKRGGREMNGLIQSVMTWAKNIWGLPKFIAAMAAYILGAHYGLEWVIWTLNALYVGIAIWNERVAR